MELIKLKKRRKIRESREIIKMLSIDSYLQVIHDYFREFHRGLRPECFGPLIAFVAIGAACMGRILIKEPTWHWLAGLPILFAMISAALHSVSLPFMMYLIPSSREQRERYIERMLLIKLLIPVLFGLLCDIAAVCFHVLTFYSFFLQIVSIFFITYPCGMLQDREQVAESEPSVYGSLKEFVSVLPVICYLGGTVMLLICMSSSISRIEFWAIFTVMTVLMLPMTLVIRKHWRQIRQNFADYESCRNNTVLTETR